MSTQSYTSLLLFTLLFWMPFSAHSAPIGQTTSNPEPSATDPVCYSFNEPEWQFHSSRKKPRVPRKESPGELLLIPDNVFNMGVAAVLPGTARPPFEATFEYSTWDDDGSTWAIWNSADGLSFFFLKDASGYGRPPAGETLGLKLEGGGYAVRFSLYGSRQAQLTSPTGNILELNHFRRAYSQREWVPVKVTVTNELISVMADQLVILEQPLQLDSSANDLGFTAASGAADAEQKIRKFCLRQLPVSTDSTEDQPEEKPETPDTKADTEVNESDSSNDSSDNSDQPKETTATDPAPEQPSESEQTKREPPQESQEAPTPVDSNDTGEATAPATQDVDNTRENTPNVINENEATGESIAGNIELPVEATTIEPAIDTPIESPEPPSASDNPESDIEGSTEDIIPPVDVFNPEFQLETAPENAPENLNLPESLPSLEPVEETVPDNDDSSEGNSSEDNDAEDISPEEPVENDPDDSGLFSEEAG